MMPTLPGGTMSSLNAVQQTQGRLFVPGTPTNIQFMVKDTKKYAATGDWGFGHFQDGKPGDEALSAS